MNANMTEGKHYGRWVECSFDCIPMRSLGDIVVPDDVSPKLAEKMRRIKSAKEKHGAFNTYYLHNAECKFHLTNDPNEGMLLYTFEGVILTDETDCKAKKSDLHIELTKETCGWLNQAVVEWLAETAQRAILIEFDRFVQAGDLGKAIERIEEIQKASDESGGFVGMYL